MSTFPSRVFAARLRGLPIFDPAGDQVGRVRDLVCVLRPSGPPRILGLVVEVFARRAIFVPMTRVTHIDSGQIITTGVINTRRFEQRPNETLVFGELLDRVVHVTSTGAEGTVFDVALEQERNHDWVVTRVAIQESSKRFGRRGQTQVAKWEEIDGLGRQTSEQGTTHLLATMEELKPADLAHVLHDLPVKRRGEIVATLSDVRLAEVLEEMTEEDQVEIVSLLGEERAADVLEEMSPDDAADLIADLPIATAEKLLELMEPDEAEDVRRLLSYEDRTAGGMMTTEPVILSPEYTVADALAHVRHEDHTPSIAAVVYVARPPLETPTGRLLGVAHIQRLLREPPSTLLGSVVDSSIETLKPEATLEEVARHLATYNLVAAPVVDPDGRLVGAVTVDDLLDHLLPDNWREQVQTHG